MRIQLPQDWFGTLKWLPFQCFGTPIWPAVAMSCKNRLLTQARFRNIHLPPLSTVALKRHTLFSLFCFSLATQLRLCCDLAATCYFLATQLRLSCCFLATQLRLAAFLRLSCYFLVTQLRLSCYFLATQLLLSRYFLTTWLRLSSLPLSRLATSLGRVRRQARLFYLKTTWTRQLNRQSVLPWLYSTAMKFLAVFTFITVCSTSLAVLPPYFPAISNNAVMRDDLIKFNKI